MEACVALEDDRYFRGRAFGAHGERTGEVVFNTSMWGYQEILTDPSYHGRILVMTCPEIGNYGIHEFDGESAEVTHLHLEDGTCEGFRHSGFRLSAAQYHPESFPGPQDSIHQFQEFREFMTTVAADDHIGSEVREVHR